jgi:hypothetical protein
LIVEHINEEEKMSELSEPQVKQEGIPHFPGITVKLLGEDGNIFNLIGIVKNEMRKNHVSTEDRSEFIHEVTSSGSYDEALSVIMKWVDVA